MKFIYLADTHIGGSDDNGYRRQPRYLSEFQTIMDCLKNYITTSSDIDFIIHGGDMVDETTHESITAAAELFGQLPCPTYLALGNHDLTTTDSVELWLKYAPQFFPDNNPDFRLIIEQVQLDVLLCNWSGIPAYWNSEEPQVPWLSPAQLQRLDKVETTCHTQIVIIHTPLYGVPPEQHGGTVPLHAPAGDLSTVIAPHIQHASLVLGAHNHINMALHKDDCYYVTTAAFSEMPFEFKTIEVTCDKLIIQTVSLSNLVPFRGDYDFDATYVQGRAIDRGFKKRI